MRPGVAASSGPREQVREAMEVVGADGRRVGFVAAIRRDDILVDRPLRRDIYVPFSAVREVTGEQVVLRIPAAEVDRQGWPHPPLV